MKKHTLPLATLGLALAAAACAHERNGETKYSESRARAAEVSSNDDRNAGDRAGDRAGDDADVGTQAGPRSGLEKAGEAPMGGSGSLADSGLADDDVSGDDVVGGLSDDGRDAIGGASGYDPTGAARAAEVSESGDAAMPGMLAHHQEGLALARLGEQKATNPEVKRLASEMRVREEQMLAMKQQTTPPAPTSETTPTAPTASPAVQALEKLSGVAFDRQWVDAAIAHHEAGQAMRDAQRDAQRDARRGDRRKAGPRHEQMQTQQQQQLDALKALQKKLAR